MAASIVFWDGYVSDEVMGIIAPVVVYWIYSGFYHAAEVLELSFVEKFRLHTKKDIDKKNLVSFYQVVRGVVFQQILQMAVASILLYFDPSAYANKPVPPLWLCAIQFFIGMCIMDTYQYFLHRWFHMNKFLYRNLHSWHHRLIVPFACGALYNHPLEGLILDTGGGAVSFLLSGMHPRVAVFFWTFATLKTVDDHCGVMIATNPLQFFFDNHAVYHDVHHQLVGLKYNFAQPFFSFWDRALGTHMPYTVQKRAEGGLEVKLNGARKSSAPDVAAGGEPKQNGTKEE